MDFETKNLIPFPRQPKQYLRIIRPLDKELDRVNWTTYYDFLDFPQTNLIYNILLQTKYGTHVIAGTSEWYDNYYKVIFGTSFIKKIWRLKWTGLS